MKSMPLAETIEEQRAGTMKSSIKVCLHVLRDARNDVRAMRAATTLKKEGFSVSIIDIEHEGTRPVEEEIDGIHLKHIIMPDWHSSRRSELRFFLVTMRIFLLSSLWLMKSQADIYHASELTALPVSFIVAKLRRKPLVYEGYELHVPVPETSVAFWRRSSKLLMWLFSIVLPRCAGVIATTPLYAKIWSERFHIPEVTVVRNIPPYHVTRRTNLLRQHIGLSSDTRIALYQGYLQRNRGLDKVIRAARYIEKDILIILMGKGIGRTQAELEALIASEGVADRVKIIPPVPRYEDLLDWTSSADIGLILYTPGYSLAVKLILPNKLFEYTMAGVPVLATQLDAIAEVINTYDVGRIVDSVAPENIGAEINKMLADHKALESMSRNALDASRRELNWEKESEQLVSLYSHIVTKYAIKGRILSTISG